MTNISCPQCGAENPLQSKYCNRCGASFSTETTHICPECSSSNPINLLYCDNCGTRLVDDSAPAGDEDNGDEAENKRLNRSEPFSLPERPPGQTGNLDVSAVLPDWLKTGDFSGDLEQGEGEDLPWLRAAQEDDAWTDDEAPTLEELSRDHAPRDDLPTWLLDEETAGAIFRGDKSTDELFMSSADDIDDSDKEQSDDQPPDPEETAAELQGWLNDLDSEEPIQAADDDGTIEPETAPLSSTTASLEMPEDDFLQWLSQIQQDTVDEEMEPPSEGSSAPVFQDEFPEETRAPEESQEEPDNEGELNNGPQEVEPDWLLGLSDDEITPEPEGTIGQETSEAPDWLIEPLEDESKEVEDFIGPNDQASFNLDDAMSEWDQIDNSTHDASESDSGVSPDPQNDDFLHWLDSLGSDEGTNEARESLAAAPRQADSEAQATEADDPETFSSDDDFRLPDWLGGLSDPGEASDVPEGPDIDLLPDWLHDLAPPGDELALPYVSGTASESSEEENKLDDRVVDFGESDLLHQEEETGATDLPDWIAAVTSELDELEDDSDAEGLQEREDTWPPAPGNELEFDVTKMALDDNQVSGDDLPDWFSDVMDDIKTDERGSRATELPDVPQQLAGEDLPDWLDSPFTEEEAAEPTPLEEIPEWLRAPLKERLARAAEERGVAGAELESGEEWRELLEAPLTTEETSEDRVRDSVPAWLESLRASARDLAGKRADSDDLESQSPVAGIEGAIGIAPVVAQAAHRTLDHTHSASASASAKAQEQQVLLLRQMARLQHDDMVVAPLSTSATRSLPAVTRLLLTLLLLAVVVAGLVGGDLLRELAPATSSDGLEATLSGIVTQSIDRPVLLVFDYSPSTAGALDPIAYRLLQEMSAQNSTILVGSQSAAGLALANRATTSGAPTSRSIGLIPGDALGVRRLGRCIAQNTACQSLFGQDIESETLRLLAESLNIVVITADRDSLLAWIEQLDTENSIALSAVVTPGLEPVARPYSATGQLAALAVANGTVDSNLNTNNNGNIAALNLAQWFVAATLVVGAAYYLLIGLIQARKR